MSDLLLGFLRFLIHVRVLTSSLKAGEEGGGGAVVVGEAIDSSWGVIQLSFVGVVTAVAAGATLAAWWWFGLGASI